MKKTLIKALSVMLAVVLSLTAAPLSGFAGLKLPEWLDFSIMSKAATTGTCGENVTWEFDEETGTLTISGTGEMVNYESDGRPWDSYEDSIKTVVINNGVTTIGNYAFSSCTYLTNVTIPDSVTTIGANTFDGCTSLTSVTIPDSVTSIGNSIFSGCVNLTSVIIPDSVISIGSHAFYECTGLISVTIPDSVTSIGKLAFYKCTSLTSVIIPDSVTSIGKDTFLGCKSLTSVTIGDGLTSIGSGAFYGCTSLTSITIPDSVTSIGSEAFEKCTSLARITLGKSVTSVGVEAFYGCNSLKEVNVIDISAWCNIIFNVSSNNDFSNPLCNGAALFLNGEKVTDLIIPNDITKLNDHVFHGCTSFTSVTIPDSVISIGKYAFSGCTSLTSITIPESVTTIGSSAFNGCTSLTSVTIPDSVTSIGDYAFYGCTSLTSVTNSNNVTTISYCMFYKCTSLTSISIGDSVTSIDVYAFGYCDSLASVIISDSVTLIDAWAFSYSSSLTTITIPDSVTIIGNHAFYNCKGLTDVYYSGTEEEWNEITIKTGNEPLLNATIHYNYCEHDYVDGTCTDCGTNKHITQEMSSQIRFDRNADGSYAGTFGVRTRAMISDDDFKTLVGATDSEAIKNINKIGFVYTVNGENFSETSAQAVAQGEIVAGYTDAPVKYVQDADGYYMFTCLVTDIPESDKDYILTAYAYICVNGKWYFSEEPMNADFNNLYTTYYPIACEKYGWEV